MRCARALCPWRPSWRVTWRHPGAARSTSAPVCRLHLRGWVRQLGREPVVMVRLLK